MNNMHVVKETAVITEKKSLLLVHPYLSSISSQTKIKFKNSLKNILNCSRLQTVFKNKTRLGNNFHFKDRIPKDFICGVSYKFQCRICNESQYGECVRNVNARIGEHTGISPLTKKRAKRSSVASH